MNDMTVLQGETNNNNNPNGSSDHGSLYCYMIDFLTKSYLRDRYIIMASSLIAEHLSQW
jgi:TorA maturation chaperone TorD